MTPASACRLATTLAVLSVLAVRPTATAPRFYADDPLRIEAEDRDASHVHALDDRRIPDSRWHAIQRYGFHARRASNVNTIDEVPDSSWFTNRIGTRALTLEEIAAGPNRLPEPLTGPWTVISGKTDGVTPGLRLKDASGHVFFVKFDPPGHPEMSSGAEVVTTKLLFALGYRVPENYIATMRREELTLDPSAQFKAPDGRKRRMTHADIDDILHHAARSKDGSYRMLASRRIEGQLLGPFAYTGVRADDPNDVVPHQDRRELRALRVFAAWLNHVDTKSENSLDTLVPVGGRRLVQHYLIDFGSALGSSGTDPKDWRDGHEYAIEFRGGLLALASLGAYTPPWLRARFPKLPAVGRIDSDTFEPERWRPTLPNPAFDEARGDDTFWAAQRVMAFSADAIRAAVATAHFGDPAATRYLADVLIARRDRIGRAWLASVNPIVRPAIADRQLVFQNAAVDADVTSVPTEYLIRWSRFDNASGETRAFGGWTPTVQAHSELPADIPPDADFVMAEIAAVHRQHTSWARPVHAYFHRVGADEWTLVGFERLEEAH
jgi:hypothetical protein